MPEIVGRIRVAETQEHKQYIPDRAGEVRHCNDCGKRLNSYGTKRRHCHQCATAHPEYVWKTKKEKAMEKLVEHYLGLEVALEEVRYKHDGKESKEADGIAAELAKLWRGMSLEEREKCDPEKVEAEQYEADKRKALATAEARGYSSGVGLVHEVGSDFVRMSWRRKKE